MPTHTVFVQADGTIKGIASPVTEGLGLVRRRASHVEPQRRTLRWVFHLIRRCVNDESRMAAFTRNWPCQWRVRLLDSGEILGPFTDRATAIDEEVRVINERLWVECQRQNNQQSTSSTSLS
jgi:hypothetical protein